MQKPERATRSTLLSTLTHRPALVACARLWAVRRGEDTKAPPEASGT